MPKPVKTFLALTIAVAALIIAIGGASLARNGDRSTESAGGGSGPGVTEPAPSGDSGGGSGGEGPEQHCGTTVTSGSGPDGVVGFTHAPGRSRRQNIRRWWSRGWAWPTSAPGPSTTIGDDDVTVAIDFVSGVEPCSVLDHVAVSYGADVVTITLFEGNGRDAGDVACIDIGVFKRVVITLDQPLGDRKIADGGLSR